jgi:hypothetical protein
MLKLAQQSYIQRDVFERKFVLDEKTYNVLFSNNIHGSALELFELNNNYDAVVEFTYDGTYYNYTITSRIGGLDCSKVAYSLSCNTEYYQKFQAPDNTADCAQFRTISPALHTTMITYLDNPYDNPD